MKKMKKMLSLLLAVTLMLEVMTFNSVSVKADGEGVCSGKFNVDISVDSELSSFTPQIEIDFQKSDGTSLATIQPIASAGDENLPEGVAKAVVKVSSDYLQNAKLKTDSEEVDLIDKIRQNGTVTCTIDPSKGYTFKFEYSSNMKNVSWSYDAANAAPDQLVEHAKIELLKSDNETDYMDKGRTDWNLTIGQEYYFVLIPDYGYQIVGNTINGQTVTPMDSVGVFKFTMSDSGFNFSGIVAPADDKVVKNTDLIGVVEIEDGKGADVNGNLKLTVAPTAADNEALHHLNQGDGSDASVYGTLDLELDEIVSKGNGQYWSTNLKELKSSVELSFIVPSNKLGEGETYSIIRKYEDAYSELENVVYNPYTEKLDFKTDKFSEYTIIKKKGAVSEHRPAGDITPHYDEHTHYYTASCVCGDESHIYYSADGITNFTNRLEDIEPQSHSLGSTGKCACGYSKPVERSSSQQETKEEVKKEEKAQEQAVTIVPNTKEAFSETVVAKVNTATPVMVDLTQTDSKVVPASFVKAIAQTPNAVVNLKLSDNLIMGISNDTVKGLETTPISISVVDSSLVSRLLPTSKQIPNDKKLIAMKPVKGATAGNKAVIYNYFGPEMVGKLVKFYVADASGTFHVYTQAIVYPNGYAAFVVPVVGFIAYAQ